MIDLQYRKNGKSYIKLGLHSEMARDLTINPEKFVGMLCVCSLEDYKKHEEILSKSKTENEN